MKTFSGLLLVALLTSLSACSNTNDTDSRTKTYTATNIQKVELGKIIAIKTVALKPEEIDSYGNLGVSIGSGGRSGVYGSVDIGTLAKIYRNTTKPTTAQQIIITKANGETVAITQEHSKHTFKIGETVKLLVENGKAKVIP